MQIAHTGDDQLCIDWVQVDNSQWDHGFTTYCWDSGSSNTNTCSTLTTTSANDWSASTTNPCEHNSGFYATYKPTPQPTGNTPSPTDPSRGPSRSPTPAP